MICFKCGQETSGNFCSSCGAPLPAEETPLINNEYRSGDFSDRPKERRGNLERPGETKSDPESSGVKSRKSRKKDAEKVKKVVVKEDVSKVKKKWEKEKKEWQKETDRENRLWEQRARKRDKELERREQETRGNESGGPDLGDMAVKGTTGMLVLIARLMQFFSCFLMAVMVWRMAGSFIHNLEGLGEVQFLIADKNQGLALYLGLAGGSLFMGVVWCLWILTRKAGGGQIRLKTYDTGRGFLPFLLCAAVIFLAGPGLDFVVSEAEVIGEAAKGAEAFLGAVVRYKGSLLSCSIVGAVLSFVRKILRV